MILYTKKYSEKVGGVTGYAGYRNRRRLNVFTKLIPVNSNDNLLEIGPNTCILLDAFKEHARSIIGIDINEEVVRKNERTDVIFMDATGMSFKDDSFNTVIAIEVLEHIPDIKKVFSEIARVVVNSGRCYLTVPFELFKGQQALGDAWFIYRDLRLATKLHVHKLNPQKIKKLIVGTSLDMIFSKLIWIPGPSFFIVLENKK